MDRAEKAAACCISVAIEKYLENLFLLKQSNSTSLLVFLAMRKMDCYNGRKNTHCIIELVNLTARCLSLNPELTLLTTKNQEEWTNK